MAEVGKLAYPDATQFDPKSPYFDAKANREAPRWLNVDVQLVRKTPFVGLPALRAAASLANMRVLARGNRLSITPVTHDEWHYITGTMMGLEQHELE